MRASSHAGGAQQTRYQEENFDNDDDDLPSQYEIYVGVDADEVDEEAMSMHAPSGSSGGSVF